MRGAAAISNESEQNWATPWWVIRAVEAEYRSKIDLDVCSKHSDKKATRYIAPVGKVSSHPEDPIAIDGLAADTIWQADHAWCNPPFCDIAPWLQKAHASVAAQTCKRVTLIVPAKTDTAWWHDWIPRAQDVIFLRPRVRYMIGGRQGGSPAFGSAIVSFETSSGLLQHRYADWRWWAAGLDAVERVVYGSEPHGQQP